MRIRLLHTKTTGESIRFFLQEGSFKNSILATRFKLVLLVWFSD